jgi:hypothetical protein
MRPIESVGRGYREMLIEVLAVIMEEAILMTVVGED